MRSNRDKKGRFIKGSSGFMGRHSEATKLKISQKKKGTKVGKDNPFYGKKHSIETRKLIGELQRGGKRPKHSEFMC